MERNVAALKFEFDRDVLSTAHGDSRCGTCGEEFENPLLAMVFADSLVEEYYACPKCLSKVASIREKNVKVSEIDEVEVEGAVEEPAALKFESYEGEAAGCVYHLGYLKNRPKNTPIPEECLTCSKMIDCMY
jgi:DNA-directed RNA polymerase subunit RPC12/RpoP